MVQLASCKISSKVEIPKLDPSVAKSEDDLQRAIALSLQDGGVTNIPTHSTTATSTVSGVSQEEQDVSKALEASLLESSLTIHAEFKPRRFAVKSCRAPEDISQACRGCPSGRHLKSVPLGAVQAQRFAVAKFLTLGAAKLCSLQPATSASMQKPTCQEETDPWTHHLHYHQPVCTPHPQPFHA